jgi:hypothetical protein
MLDVFPEAPYYVIYTPNTGFRGLDTFKYHWVYDRMDYSGNRTGNWVPTNVSKVEVQVGPWIDLTAGGERGANLIGVE